MEGEDAVKPPLEKADLPKPGDTRNSVLCSLSLWQNPLKNQFREETAQTNGMVPSTFRGGSSHIHPIWKLS